MPRPLIHEADPEDAAVTLPPLAPRAPAAAPGNPLLAGVAEAQPIEITAVRRQAPVFEGTIVIYLGSNPYMSITLRGALVVTKAEEIDPQTGQIVEFVQKTVPHGGGEGNSSYSFQLHDSVGRLNVSLLIPPDHKTLGRYGGKPFHIVEHPDHIRHFYLSQAPGGGNEFKVVPLPHRQREMIDYFMFAA